MAFRFINKQPASCSNSISFAVLLSNERFNYQMIHNKISAYVGEIKIYTKIDVRETNRARGKMDTWCTVKQY